MTDTKKLFEDGAGLLGLKDDIALIEALVAVAKNAATLASHIDGIASAEDFLTRFTADMNGADVKKAFALAGLDDLYTTLTGLLGKAGAALGKVPDKYKKLLAPIAAYNKEDAAEDSGLVRWTLLDESKDFPADKNVTIGGGASAHLAFEAGDRATLAGQAVDKPLLRLGIDAALNGKAGGKVPIDFAAVTGSAEGALSLDFETYFDTGDANPLFGLAVATRLPRLPNPFDFDAVWEAFQAEDLGLEALVYTFTESAKAKVSVAFADSGSFAKVLVDVKAAIAAEASLTRTFQLTMRAKGDAGGARGIDVLLTRGAQSKKSVTAGLTVGVNFAVPAAKVHDLLKQAVDKWDKILGEITPYLSPGTLLQTKLGGLLDDKLDGLIADPGLRAAIAQDLHAVIGVDPSDDSALKQWLTKEVTDAIDAGATKILDEVGQVRDLALAQLAKRLPSISKEAPDAIREKLNGAIDPLIEKAKGELVAKLEELIDRPGNLLGKALKHAGVWSGQQVAALDEILAPVRKLIAHYNALLHKALDFTADASRAKISASLQLQDQWLWGEEDQIAGTFTAASEAAADLFGDLTHGRLKALAKLVHKDVAPPPEFTLDTKRSFVKKSAERSSGGNFALVLFGIAGGGSWLLDGKASVLLDGDGNVQIDDKGSAETRFTGQGEEREVSFVDTHALQLVRAADGTSAATQSIGISVAVVDQDRAMSLKELGKFIQSLEKSALIAPGTAERAAPRFVAWAGGKDGDKKVPANIAARLTLDKAGVERLMQLDGRQANGQLTDEAAAAMAACAHHALDAAGASGMDELAAGIETVGDALSDDSGLGDDAYVVRLARTHGRIRDKFPEFHGASLPAKINAVIAQQARIGGLVDMVEALGRIYLAVPATPANPDGWDEKEFRDAQFAVATGASRWLFSNGTLVWLNSAVHPVTAAFLRTLADLAGLPSGTGLSLVLTRKDADGALKETVVLA